MAQVSLYVILMGPVETLVFSFCHISKKRNVEECVDSNKSAKLVIETGIWSCNYTYCNIEDNDDMLTCGKYKKTLHYQCSKLPAYQVSLFLSQKYKKKFLCESCVEVPESLTEKCTSSISNEKQNDESDRLKLNRNVS